MLQPADDAGQSPVVVIGDTLWRNRFAADPNIVGKTVKIGSRPFEIVGVAPDAFDGLTVRAVPVAGWLPISTLRALSIPSGLGAALPSRSDRDRPRLSVVGRLTRGRTVGMAAAELVTIGAARDGEAPRAITAPDGSKIPLPRLWSARAILDADNDPNSPNAGLLLLTLVGLVLVVACTNLGNLILSRGAYREHELAVRRALGASRWRLVRELISETVLIVAMAGATTVLLTRALLAFATRELSTPLGALSIEPRLNVPAAVVASGSLLLSMLVFGLDPALPLTRRPSALSLASGSSTTGAGRGSRQRAFIRCRWPSRDLLSIAPRSFEPSPR